MVCQAEGHLFVVLIMNKQFPPGVDGKHPRVAAGAWMHICLCERVHS